MAKFANNNEIQSCTARVCVNEALKLLKEEGSYEAILGDPISEELFRTLVPASGTVVGSLEKGTLQVLDTDSHDVIVASSGRKKTRAEILPSIISFALNGTPMVINDMKGEILSASRGLLEAMGYKVIVLDYRNPEGSPNCFNLLSLAWHRFNEGDADAATKVIRNVAEVLYAELSSNTNDVYWTHMSVEYFSGLALGLLEYDCPLEAFTLETVYATANMDHARLKMVFSELKGTIAERNVHGTLYAPNDTRASIESVFAAPLSTFCSQQGLMQMMSNSDFMPCDLAEKDTALFIVSPDENASVAPIVTAMFSQLMSELVSVATRRGGVLPNAVQFVLDEFGNLRRIPNLEHIVSAARSRGLRLHIVLQSTSQLSYVYGKDIKEIIVGNIYNWIYMGTRDLCFLKEFSEQLGTASMPSGKEAPVLSVPILGTLEKREEESEAICLIEDLLPYLATLPDYGYLEALPAPSGPLKQSKRHARKVFDISKGKRKTARPVKKQTAQKDTDIDALIRKIDARIAGLEAEEAAKDSE